MILETAMRNALAQNFNDQVNTGAGTATLVFETSADAEVATINLQNPAFGAPATGTITLLGVPLSDLDAAGGTTVQASIFNRDAAKQSQLSVATSGAEITITNNVITATERVDLTSLQIIVPAGS